MQKIEDAQVESSSHATLASVKSDVNQFTLNKPRKGEIMESIISNITPKEVSSKRNDSKGTMEVFRIHPNPIKCPSSGILLP